MATKKLKKTKEELKEFVNSEQVFTVKELRDYLGISQIKFSKRYEIPRRTIEDWEAGRREAPPYVLKLLNYVVKDEVKSDLRYGRI
ncbi:MAG: helix-turn-helix domain-containing protein [Clostridiales bacterium]|nr:helix-turn-helix domain-containing protein [Clostridiales bacterium]